MDYSELLPQLIRAGLDGDRRTVEAIGLMAIKKLRRNEPSVADQIANILAHNDIGASTMRAVGFQDPPKDRDTNLDLAVVDLKPILPVEPVFSNSLKAQIDLFLRERLATEKFLSEGLNPPKSLLLIGPPGVGKTLLASVIAKTLQLPLITLNLSSAISSYLGKTGQNLNKVLNYARNLPSVLLLDEFDAVAKRRDDPTDLGELKRIVNVLLKELETWPIGSIVLAATNHPNLLDPAIWRRFDKVINFELPQYPERVELFRVYLENKSIDAEDKIYHALGVLSDQLSPSDISKLSERIKRRFILDGGEFSSICFDELLKTCNVCNGNRGEMARTIYNVLGRQVTTRELGKWLGIEHSTVSYHLNKGKKEGEDLGK